MPLVGLICEALVAELHRTAPPAPTRYLRDGSCVTAGSCRRTACGRSKDVIPKSFDEIRPDDVLALIQDEVREGRTIEYKRALPGGG